MLGLLQADGGRVTVLGGDNGRADEEAGRTELLRS